MSEKQFDIEEEGVFEDYDGSEEAEVQGSEYEESEFVLQYHPYFEPLYDDTNPFYYARHHIYYGGRAGRKSWEIARGLLLRAAKSTLRIVCAREFQNSIADSVHALLKDQMKIIGIEDEFDVQKTVIYHKVTGTQFIFKGIAGSSAQSLKSLEGCDICWVEEAQVVSEESWRILTPTIRKPESQIIISFNPDLIDDPTSQRFLVNTPPDSYKVLITYLDNPDCSEVTRADAEWCRITDIDAYNNIWLGQFRKASDAQILKDKWQIMAFEPGEDWSGPYYGLDFGFSTDPVAVVECWVYKACLFIRREVVSIKVELDDLPDFIKKMPGIRGHKIIADNSRPETISHLNRHGLRVSPSLKWDGSLEDGIQKLRSFLKIYIHPDCKETASEAKFYSYKVDRLTGEVLPVVVDKYNHCIDAIRYAIEKIIISKLMRYSQWTRNKDE